MSIYDNPFKALDERLSNIENVLIDLSIKSKPTSTPEPTERWFNLNELCEYLPDKPTKATVYGWVSAKKIPHHKGGKKLRFLKSEIDRFLKQGKKQTIAEIEQDVEKLLTPKKAKNGY